MPSVRAELVEARATNGVVHNTPFDKLRANGASWSETALGSAPIATARFHDRLGNIVYAVAMIPQGPEDRILRGELKAGERILWSSRPDPLCAVMNLHLPVAWLLRADGWHLGLAALIIWSKLEYPWSIWS